MKRIACFVFVVALTFWQSGQIVTADNNFFALSPTTPFLQNWTDTSLITANDNWTGVPSIRGFLGEDGFAGTAVDPQTMLVPFLTPDVIANQTNTGITQGGVAEFQIADPVVALQASGAADFPHFEILLDASACVEPNGVRLRYDLRDIDGSTDNSIQPIAVHYRIGITGNYSNLPDAFVSDATTGPSEATLVTQVDEFLPVSVRGEPQVHVRFMTSNSVGNDEWVGIDNLNVTCENLNPTAARVRVGGRVITANGRGIGNTRVMLTGGNLTEPLTAVTNQFGYYHFEGIEAGQTYIITVGHKRYAFSEPSRVIELFDNLSDVDFVAVF